jgi:acyl dehydratase
MSTALKSRSIESFAEGNSFTHEIIIDLNLIENFIKLSGDKNALHINQQYAIEKGFKDCVVHGNILGMMLSHLIGMKLGQIEIMLISQELNFRSAVYVEDHIVLSATITKKHDALSVIELKLIFKNQNDVVVCSGNCRVKCI